MSKQVSISEFKDIFEISVELHKGSNDPIPALSKQSIEKMQGCLSMPFMTFGGEDLYKTIYDKASILFYLINKGHNLENGNKRMSYIITEYFLFKNNINLNLTDAEIYDLTLIVAKSDANKKDETIKYIKSKINTKKIKMENKESKSSYETMLRKYDKLGAYLEDAIEDKNASETTRLKAEMSALETKINNYERGGNSFSYSIGGL